MSKHKHSFGGARISTTPWAVAQNPATPATRSSTAVSAGFVTTFLIALFSAALATAAPAAAVDDPSRPEGRVTHGPSCHPGGLVVEVVAGSSPYSVRLATTRTPAGEAEASLQPGQAVVLQSADVAWGETIDGRLEFAAQDGTGVTFVDELEEYSFTRPTKEDCDAIGETSSTAPETTSGAAADTAPAEPTTAAAGAGPTASGGAAPSVPAGGTITLQAAGFLPGEVVTFHLHGTDTVLATATARADGTVQTDVRIPDGIDAGGATVRVVGADSETVADVAVRVAGAEAPIADGSMTDVLPLAAAAAALVAAVAGLFSVVGRQRHGRPIIRSV